ncbi:hypothetical protein B0533_08725 [Sedimentibacter sp. SX930]|nr:hypothetical protein B0533_08725 [Sedimentibacter sp. SX930]
MGRVPGVKPFAGNSAVGMSRFPGVKPFAGNSANGMGQFPGVKPFAGNSAARMIGARVVESWSLSDKPLSAH